MSLTTIHPARSAVEANRDVGAHSIVQGTKGGAKRMLGRTCPAMARFGHLEKPVVKSNDEMVGGALLTNYSFFKFYAAVDPETLLDLRVLIVPRNTSLTDTVAKAMDLKRKMRYGSRLQYFLC